MAPEVHLTEGLTYGWLVIDYIICDRISQSRMHTNDFEDGYLVVQLQHHLSISILFPLASNLSFKAISSIIVR